MKITAVLVGGGRPGPDVLEPLCGVPMIARSVLALLGSGLVERVQILGMAQRRGAVLEACRGLPVDVPDGWLGLAPVGQHAVQRHEHQSGDGAATWHAAEVVVAHDARRPLAPAGLAEAVIDAVRSGHDVAVPVLPLSDTVKLVNVDGLLSSAADRSGLRVVQTPQAFRVHPPPSGPGLCCLDLPDVDLPSLDLPRAAAALAASGVIVHTIVGDPLAFPVLSEWDLQMARLLAARP